MEWNGMEFYTGRVSSGISYSDILKHERLKYNSHQINIT